MPKTLKWTIYDPFYSAVRATIIKDSALEDSPHTALGWSDALQSALCFQGSLEDPNLPDAEAHDLPQLRSGNGRISLDQFQQTFFTVDRSGSRKLSAQGVASGFGICISDWLQILGNRLLTDWWLKCLQGIAN